MPEESGVAVAEPVQTQEPSGGGSDIYHHKLGESQEGVAAARSDSDSEKPAPASEGQKPKELSRYERTKRERAAFRAEREAFQREREAFNRERAQAAQAAKPKRDYTVDELRKYRTQWEREGQFDLVEAADKEIAVMEQEQVAERATRTVELPPVGTPEHRAQWEAAERELYQADPEFMRSGTRLDSALRSIMAGPDGDIYRQHPRGIIAAYHRAKMELLDAEVKELQTTNSKLQNELKRYQGLTGIGAGSPARVGNGSRVESVSDFEKLSTKDMRKHLLANADRNGVPWF
jgi:hypothetical protein